MSILPCDRDPRALRVVVDGFWDLDALREHLKACDICDCVRDALAAMTGSQGGSAGRGVSKRRGGSDYYRTLGARARHKALR
jgi:hypothetical protein